jgi:uncharacterized protein
VYLKPAAGAFTIAVMTNRTGIFLAVLTTAVFLLSLSVNAADPAPTWRTDLLKWRAQRAKNLTGPEGWLSLVGLDWLQSGNNVFGSAADNAVVLKKELPAHMGIFRLDKNTVTLVAPTGGFPKSLKVDGRTPQNGQTLVPDDAEHTSKITAGTLTILIIHRSDRYGVRIKDAQAPTLINFHGLKWFDPNPAYRVRAKWTPYNPAKQKPVATIIGTTENMAVPGVAEFTLDGKSYRLEPVLEEPGDKQLFFIMRDTTSKSETYGAGRFLYTAFPDHGLTQPGELWIDFNRMQNPPCAYTPYATCPLPPPENRLQVAIPAGEKRYHE